MKIPGSKLLLLLLAPLCLSLPAARADSYSIDASIVPQKDEGTLSVDVRVARLTDQDGASTEQVVAQPHVQTTQGTSTSISSNIRSLAGATNQGSVTVEVSWPYINEPGTALCAVTVQQGYTILAKARWQLKIEAPGRAPLVISAQDVNPRSIQVIEAQPDYCVLLDFSNKTWADIKKLFIENTGNKIQIRDAHGNLVEGITSFSIYHEIGLNLHFKTKAEADQVAAILQSPAPAKP